MQKKRAECVYMLSSRLNPFLKIYTDEDLVFHFAMYTGVGYISKCIWWLVLWEIYFRFSSMYSKSSHLRRTYAQKYDFRCYSFDLKIVSQVNVDRVGIEQMDIQTDELQHLTRHTRESHIKIYAQITHVSHSQNERRWWSTNIAEL